MNKREYRITKDLNDVYFPEYREFIFGSIPLSWERLGPGSSNWDGLDYCHKVIADDKKHQKYLENSKKFEVVIKL